jgi:hypothetical protein
MAMLVIGLGRAPMALAQTAVPPPPGGSGGTFSPSGGSNTPESWQRGTQFDDSNQTKVSDDDAQSFSQFWTVMFLDSQVEDPQLRVRLSELGLDVKATSDPSATADVRTPLLQQYLDSDDVLPPMFSGFTPAERRYLLVYLIKYWHQNVPGFTQAMNGTVPQPEKVDRMTHLDLADVLAAVIFDKDGFKRGMGRPFGGDDGSTTMPAGAPQPGTVNPADQAAAILSEAAAALPAPDAIAAAVVPPDIEDVQAQVWRFVPPIDPAVVTDQAVRAATAVTDNAADPPGVADIQALVDQAFYWACAGLPGTAMQCQKKLLGELATFDLGGALGPDVSLALSLDPTAGAGLGGRLVASRLSATGTTANVVARMYIDQAEGQLSAGFNGLPALTQTAAAGLDDPVAARSGDIRLRATVTHTGTTATTLTLTGGFAKLDSASDTSPEDAVSAIIKLERAPTLLLVQARMAKVNGTATAQVSVDAPLASPTLTATVTQVNTQASSTRTAVVVVDSIPDHAEVVLEKAPSGHTTLDYKASKVIKKLTATVTETSSAGPSRFSAVLDEVPAALHVDLDNGHVAYTSSSRIKSATVSNLDPDQGVSRRFSATVTNVPANWSVDYTTGGALAATYWADGAIERIVGSYEDPRRNREAAATITKFPAGTTTFTMDGSAGTMSYSSADVIPSIVATGSVDGFKASLTLAGIPKTWNAKFGDQGLSFAADGEGFGSISAYATNHGEVFRPAGNHAAVRIVEQEICCPGTIKKVDASFVMTKVKQLTVSTGEPAVTTIEAGGGAPFRAYALINKVNGAQALADATLTPLPKSVNLSLGRTIAASASENFDLRASVHYADDQYALAAIGPIPAPHGVAIRDGRAGDAEAFGAKLYLTGLPTTATIGTGSFSMKAFKPKISTLTVDIDLDDALPEPIRATATISSLPTSLDLDVSTSSRPVAGGGTEQKVLVDAHGKPLGALTTQVRRGPTGGKLTVSNLPSRIEGTVTETEGQTTVDWKSAPITSIQGEFHHQKADGSLEVAGKVTINKVPGDLTLVAGRDPGGAGPVLSYHAGQGGTDIVVTANGSLKKDSSSLAANLDFVVQGLAKDVEISAKASKVELTTSDPIRFIQATVSASYSYNKQGKDTLNEGSWLSFPYEYRVALGAGVENFVVTLSNVSSFVLEPGLISKVSGLFDSFDFKWGRLPIHADLYGSIKARIDWPSPFGVSTILLAQATLSFNHDLDILFHRYVAAERKWVSATLDLWLCDIGVDTYTRPGRDGAAWGSQGVHFGNPAAVGGTYYVVPNPEGLVPTALVDLAAFALTDGNSFRGVFNGC